MKNQISRSRLAGILGISGVSLFLFSLLAFTMLNSSFKITSDFVSKLGAIGQPYALVWNIVGFLMVGILLFGFGLIYGKIVEDSLTGLLLSFFGVGFAFTAIPVDLQNSEATVSKAHVVTICLALAFWLFGLARISSRKTLSAIIIRRANLTAILLVSSMIGSVINLWSMPVTHRLVFGVVFGWTWITSFELLFKKGSIVTNQEIQNVS